MLLDYLIVKNDNAVIPSDLCQLQAVYSPSIVDLPNLWDGIIFIQIADVVKVLSNNLFHDEKYCL